ncbi:DUF1214 domain-containing protein [Paraburkholderia sp. NPDC080076]|uniref:DUF1214 domain-containing protein n=1 Tax=Paraburkholderia sp. NPDC080076 TaxID=3390605 RepID=UPI003D060599
MQKLFRVSAAALLAWTLLAGLDGCKSVPIEQTPPVATDQDPGATVSDTDVVHAYHYLLGRLLVLRQQRLDFEKDGFQWNHIVHRKPGSVEWANPNLDVLYSEAWVALDEKTCVLLDIPRIEGRYYTWQMLDGWGETVLNINERTFAQRPYGRYALCLKGGRATPPADALRIDLPVRTMRVLARIEPGDDPAQATGLQHEFRLTPLGEPRIEAPIEVPLFTNARLPRAEAFDFATQVLDGQPDLAPGMDEVRTKVRAVAALVQSDAAGRTRVDDVIARQALPALAQRMKTLGPTGNGWVRPMTFGHYGSDYLDRTIVDLVGIWANTRTEVTFYGMPHLDGSATYTQTYPKDAPPQSLARYFWSVTEVDSTHYKVVPNQLGRYALNRQSRVQPNADGSVTLAFGPARPDGVPESNWLPTQPGTNYNLTFRLYGPAIDVAAGQYFPPPLVRQH